jgi:hypothetical protein
VGADYSAGLLDSGQQRRAGRSPDGSLMINFVKSIDGCD